MAKFRFKLEPLLKARRMVEQTHQRAVAEIERERMTLEARLRAQQEHLAEGKKTMRSDMVGQVNIQGLRMHAASSLHQMRIAQRLVLELAGVHRRLEAARASLIEAARRRRAVELLKERRFLQWRTRLEKAETAALDELAVIAAARRRDSGIDLASEKSLSA